LVIAGGILAGLGYALGAVTIGSSGCGADHWLLLPVAGPSSPSPTSRTSRAARATIPKAFATPVRMYSAIGQGVGGGLLLLAAANQKTYLVADSASTGARANPSLALAIVPALGPSSAGVSMLGTF